MPDMHPTPVNARAFDAPPLSKDRNGPTDAASLEGPIQEDMPQLTPTVARTVREWSEFRPSGDANVATGEALPQVPAKRKVKEVVLPLAYELFTVFCCWIIRVIVDVPL